MVDTNKNPKVSVVIPLYNRKDYIKDCITSILNQDFEDLEIVIVDDASTDGSDWIVAEFSDPRIRFFRNEANKGISFTRNRLTNLAKGEYVAILDSDDIACENRIGLQVNYLDNNPNISLVAGRADLINEKGELLGRSWGEEHNWQSVRARLPFENLIIQSTVMARREFFLSYPYDGSLSTSEDYDIWLRGSIQHNYAILGKIVTFYRIHGGNISQEKKTEINKNSVDIRIAFLEKIAGVRIKDTSLNGIIEDSAVGAEVGFGTFRLLKKLYKGKISNDKQVLNEWESVLKYKWHRSLYKFKYFKPICIKYVFGPLANQIPVYEKIKYTLKCVMFKKNKNIMGEQKTKGIIYDIGFHIGQDTEYYLKKGFTVIGVDADPLLIEEGHRKFMKALSSGKLILVNRAIYEKDDTEVDFFVAKNSEWSSLVQEYAERNNIPTRHIRVATSRLDTLFNRYGKPYFLKIDIEGYDVNALRTITPEMAPEYISVEALSLTADHIPDERECLATLNELRRLGYRRFRLIDQTEFAAMEPGKSFYGVDRFAREPRWAGLMRRFLMRRGYKMKRYNHRDWMNARCNHLFEYGSAGPLPEELDGNWLNADQAALAIKFHLAEALKLKMNGFWVDWHGRK